MVFDMLGDCFGWLWRSEPETFGRMVNRRPENPYILPSLEDACRRERRGLKGQYRLARRRLQVATKLVPVALACCVDLRRSKGPKNLRTNTRNLRISLEALGPAFVKLGQCAATREDVLADEITSELRQLCDQVKPFPTLEALALAKEELGQFAPFGLRDPVAAASLGQVHLVEFDGVKHAMKVQRPGLEQALALDVIILKSLARKSRWIMKRITEITVDPVDIIDNWAKTFWDELDYNKEAQASERMRKVLEKSVPDLRIPKVNFERSSTRVLSTVWVDGQKVTTNPKSVQQKHIEVGVQAFATMILEVGTVHADPHAGNMIITHDNKVCLLDFGMVISVPESHRKAWAKLVVDLVGMDHEAVLQDLIDLGFFPPDCPRAEILPVMSKIWRQLVECGSDIRKRKAAVNMLYDEIMIFVRKLKFGLPDYYLALLRALITLEGIALAADCEFDIFQAIFPVAIRFVRTSSVADQAALGKAVARSSLRSASAAVLENPVTSATLALSFAGLAWLAVAGATNPTLGQFYR